MIRQQSAEARALAEEIKATNARVKAACEATSKIEVDSANLEKIAADAAKAKSVTAEVKATVEALKAKTAAAAAIKVNI